MIPVTLPAFIRRRSIWLGLALLVAAWLAAGFLGVPRLVRSLATDLVRTDYGRELALGAVRFNPFTLALEAEGLALPDAPPATRPLVALDRLRVNLSLGSLWRRALTFDEIRAEGLAVSAVVRPDGGLNLQDLVPPASSAEPESGGLPALLIHSLVLEGGRIRFEDQSRPEPFVAEVAPLGFSLTDFSTHGDTDNRYRLDARVFDDARLAWRGTLAVEPLASAGELSVEGLPLPRLAAWLGDALPVEVSTGTASLAGRYRLGGNGPDEVLGLEDGRLEIRDLALRSPGTETDLVALPAILLTGISADGLARQARVESVAVTGGLIQAWLDPDGRLNLQDLAGPADGSGGPSDDRSDGEAAGKPGDPSEDDSDAGSGGETVDPDWQVSIPAVAVRELAVSLEDRSLEPAGALRLEPVNLDIQGLATTPGAVATVTLDTALVSGGRLGGTAQVNLDDLATEAELELAELDLRAIQPWLETTTGITLRGGLAGLKGKLRYRNEGEGEGAAVIDATVDLAVDAFRLIDDRLQEDLLKWQRLEVRGVDWRGRPERLRIREVVVRQPFARLIIGPEGITNVAVALSPPGTVQPPVEGDADGGEDASSRDEGAAPPPEPLAPFPVTVGSITIRDGATRFSDFSTRPNFTTGIESLEGRITGLSSDPRSRARVDLKGQVDPTAPVTIKGEVNPLSAETYLDLAMAFRNVDMADFTPYSGRFAGYAIRRGTLSVDLNYKVEDRALKADHRFVIDQLELGDRVESPDAPSLPLKLAVALLKDRNGVIRVDLPVSGDLDDPRFRIAPIVWKAFVNLVTRAATAPFALLGSVFGGGEDLNVVDFRPGRAVLTVGEMERTSTLARALVERPAIALNVPAVYNRALDRPALAEQELERRIVARARPDESGAAPDFDAVAADRRTYLDLLRVEFRALAGRDTPLPGPPPDTTGEGDSPEPLIALLEQGIRARIEIPDAALEELANWRAAAVRDGILAGGDVAPDRVTVLPPAEARTEGGMVVMELALR
jgi:hypothetical protein